MSNNSIHITPELRNLIPKDIVTTHKIIPKASIDNKLELWIDENLNNDSIKVELEALLGSEVTLFPTSFNEINKALNEHYFLGDYKNAKNLEANSNDILDMLIQDAIIIKSSDIHIESYRDKCRVRMRVDGDLVERFSIDKSEYNRLTNKIKNIADLDTSEKRMPQDGRISYKNDSFDIDLRVSTLPTVNAEKIVMRLLNNSQETPSFKDVGLDGESLVLFKKEISRPNGIVLISGPTGSGKSTTLASVVSYLNEIKRNIVTIEDPVEFLIEGVNQVPVNQSLGRDYMVVLDAILRQDPNVVMIGEVRNKETAEALITSSLQGRLLLSTIHTNSAIETITRLLDMGIPGYKIASTLNFSVAQRLVKKLCKECKSIQHHIKDEYVDFFNQKNIIHYEANGCEKCNFKGYRGRQSIFELFQITPYVQELIRTEKFHKKELDKLTFPRLKDQAIELVEKGITSIEEAYPLLIN